jgi:hypothetical protein
MLFLKIIRSFHFSSVKTVLEMRVYNPPSNERINICLLGEGEWRGSLPFPE